MIFIEKFSALRFNLLVVITSIAIYIIYVHLSETKILWISEHLCHYIYICFVFNCVYLCNFYSHEIVAYGSETKKKWNESGFRPPLCTYRLNWARRTSWGWWDDWDDTVLQTQDSKFEPWRSEAEHATSRSRRLPTILTFTRGWGRNNFCFFQTAKTGNRTPDSGVKGSGANHYPRAGSETQISNGWKFKFYNVAQKG